MMISWKKDGMKMEVKDDLEAVNSVQAKLSSLMSR